MPLWRRRADSSPPPGRVDLGTQVGSIVLPGPIMNASGTAGHGCELADYVDLSTLGAFVAKSLCVGAWPGNPSPRVHMTPAGMLNGVGLQGPGIDAWLSEDLPALVAAGVQRIVVSIWGHDLEGYRAAAARLAGAPASVLAIEVNLSCPNTEAGRVLFAHDPVTAAQVVAACTAEVDVPIWAKLSPNTDRLVEVAGAVAGGGAEAVTLINTVFGMVIDVESKKPVLSRGGGGVSGAAIRPMAVRAVHDVHSELPNLSIVGVGGVSNGIDALELLLAGASAVQVGTAAFADPRVLTTVGQQLEQWCAAHGVASVRELIGGAHVDN